jgi:hypothetical protein
VTKARDVLAKWADGEIAKCDNPKVPRKGGMTIAKGSGPMAAFLRLLDRSSQEDTTARAEEAWGKAWPSFTANVAKAMSADKSIRAPLLTAALAEFRADVKREMA